MTQLSQCGTLLRLEQSISITRALLLVVSAMVFASSAVAQAVDYPPKPSGHSHYVDREGWVSAADAVDIDIIGSSLLRDEQVALYVVIISSLADQGASGYTIESYAQMLFNHWGIGSDDRNYGMLLLVSPGDRKARIELGTDWDSAFDRDARKIMNSLIIPAFKREEYSSGIVAGVRGLDAMARGLELPKAPAPRWLAPLIIGLVLLTIGVIVSLFKSGRSGWGWILLTLLGVAFVLLSRSRGVGGGFSGGYSGGGGATGSW